MAPPYPAMPPTSEAHAMLLSAKSFMMKTMIKEGGWNASSWAVKEQALQASRDHWAALSQSWKEEPDMALAAIKGRIVTDLRDLPDALRMDRAFLIQAIRVRPRTWLTLPEPFAHDVEMAKITPSSIRRSRGLCFLAFPVCKVIAIFGCNG